MRLLRVLASCMGLAAAAGGLTVAGCWGPRVFGASGQAVRTRGHLPPGFQLRVAGPRHPGALVPADPPRREEITRLRIPSPLGRPKIAYSFNPDDDLAAIRRAGFTHILVSYLQGAPDEEQRRKLDECQRYGLKLIYRLVDLVDQDRRGGSDNQTQHAVLLLRSHPALAAWQTFEETNLPPDVQIGVYRKIKRWDPQHPVIVVTTNEYSAGWYHRTYSDDAQDVLMVDFYPYKRRYDGWIYIRTAVPALRAAQKRPVPIMPILQASSSSGVASAEDTTWPPPGGLEKQLNLWWSLGADAGVAFWVWRGSHDYPFVGIADRQAPPYALPETASLLARIPDGELPFHTPGASAREVPAVRLRRPTVNYLKNSGFEHGLEGWGGYNEGASWTSRAYAGRGAARLENAGAPKPMGIGQGADLLLPPNATVTLSCYYKVVRETTLLQWMINTTAYPKFGAADFFERKERLPAGDWQRGSISATNSTGVVQRITGVSVISNGFTGEVLLDNFQLELAPRASAYTDRTPQGALQAARATGLRATGLHYDLPQARRSGRVPARRAGTREAGGVFRRSGHQVIRSSGHQVIRSSDPGWTLTGWSAPETPPEPGHYACLAALVRRTGPPLELRLRVDPKRSDLNGWLGALEVAAADDIRLRMPIALAPNQPLFWALCGDGTSGLTLRAAPAGYRLAGVSGRFPSGPRWLSSTIQSLCLGTDANGGHSLDGRAGGGQFVPGTLSLAGVEGIRGAAGDGR